MLEQTVERLVVVALRQAPPFPIEEHRNVRIRERRRLRVQRGAQEFLLRRAFEQVETANHLRDALREVIDHNRELVRIDAI